MPILLLLTAFICWTEVAFADEPKPTLDQEATRKLEIDALTRTLVDGHSRRGDLMFEAGNDAAAVADYAAMVTLDPSRDRSHWRKGIAHFFAGEYAEGAAQFDRYHSFDQVDRENGIWRYLCMHKAEGKPAARKELLRYEKDDREPFGDVYRLFDGSVTGDAILKKINAAELSEAERNKRLFYAHLYVGLNDWVEDRNESAATHLAKAAENSWPARAGYGPAYMQTVSRRALDRVRKTEKVAE